MLDRPVLCEIWVCLSINLEFMVRQEERTVKKSLIVYISWLSWCYAYMGHSLWAYYRTIFVCTSSTLLILEIKSHFSDRPDLVSVDFPVAWSPRFLTSRFSYFFSSDRGAVQKQVKMSNDVKLPIYIHRHLSAQMTG